MQARLEAGNLVGSKIDVERHDANLSLLRAFAAGNVPVAAVEHMKASNMVFRFVSITLQYFVHILNFYFAFFYF